MNARAMALFGMLAFCAAAQAKTVAWYRFEEEPCGTITTGDTVFTNTIDATKYPAYARVMTGSSNNKYPSNLSTDSERMPIYTNAFPETISLVNAADCPRIVPNRRAVDLRNPVNNHSNPASVILIDDHEDLWLKSFTLEFFARIPDTSAGFRTLVTRNGGKYVDSRRAFQITTSCLGGSDAKLYFQYALSVTNGVPLYDASGVVTNAIFTNVTYSTSAITYDNDKWHHIALTVDDTEKKARLYVDYTLCKTLSFPGSLYYEPGSPISFGGNVQCGYYSFECTFDEIRLSDAVLDPKDFLHYTHTSTASDAVDDNTLFYFDFEGSQESTTLGADVMNSPITMVPFYANKAVSGPYVGVNGTTTASLKTGPTNRAAPTSSSSVAGQSVRFGLRAQSEMENTASFYMATNSPANDWADGFALPTSVTSPDLFADSLTIESYFRLPSSSHYLFPTGTQGHVFCMTGGFQVRTPGEDVWSRGRLQAYIGDTALGQVKPGVSNSEKLYTTADYRDGKWHHLAIVYDAAAKRGDFYVDCKLQLSGTGVSNTSPSSSHYANFLAGVSYWKERCFSNIMFDNIRITRGALRPYQFLTTIPVEPPVDELARASFDGDLVLTPYTNFFGAAGTASAFSSGGAVPAFTGDKPGRTITEGKDGDVLKAVNHGALAFSGGKVAYAKRALAAATDAFTAELFVKVASGAAGDGIMRVERGAGEATEALLWSLGFADASGNLALKVCTDGENVQSHPFGGALADGAWHHVAVRFSADGADGTAEVFRDGVQLGAWTFDGRLPCDPAEVNLTLGGGDEGAAGFVGALDELRMTAGFLPAERFMSAFTPGLAFVIR